MALRAFKLPVHGVTNQDESHLGGHRWGDAVRASHPLIYCGGWPPSLFSHHCSFASFSTTPSPWELLQYMVTIEKTPSYFISREAPARIRAMNETIKLLLIVREPAMRVLSDYAQIMEAKMRKGKQVAPFHKKVLTLDGEINDGFKAIQISQYAVHVLRWLREFPREQIHIIDGDNLVSDPFTEINKVQQFLRLPLHIKPDNFYFNETKGFYCMRNETFQKCLADAKGRPHPHVDPAVMSRLRKFFAPFNEQFYEMMGRNFGWPTS